MTLLITTHALAQTAAAPIASPTPPTPPTVAMPSQSDIASKMLKLGGGKNSEEVLGQVMVVGSLLGCTQKTAGKEATQAFYGEMQKVGKTAESYCKQGQATEARALLLSTFAAKKNDAVVKAGLGCYDVQAQMVQAMGGKRLATDAAHYARWLRDPEIAKSEMKETDICRNSKG
jgi:hypothetical protein